MSASGAHAESKYANRGRVRRPVRWIAIGAATAIVALAVTLAFVIGNDPYADSQRSHLVGRAAPNFDLPTLDGGRTSLDELAGRAVIVNFWNSWCVPCIQEHPALVEFYRLHATDPKFAMIGIVRDDTRTAIERYVRSKRVPYTVAFDPGSRAALAFGTRGQPETYAISPGGRIVSARWGPSSVADLETMLQLAQRNA